MLLPWRAVVQSRKETGRGGAGPAAFKNTEETQQMLAWPLLLAQSESAGLCGNVWPAKETVRGGPGWPLMTAQAVQR